MEGSDVLLLFANSFFNVISAVVSVAVAILIRNRIASFIVVLLAGAIVGLVGSSFELLDIYLTREGWAAFGALDAITVFLSMLASVAWWGIARLLYVLARRILSRSYVRH